MYAQCGPVLSHTNVCPLPVQAALERLLQQLVGVQDEWLEANGGLMLSCVCVPYQAALECCWGACRTSGWRPTAGWC